MISHAIISLIVLCYTAITLGILTNGILLVIFVRMKQLRSLPANKLICSLLFSDLLIETSFALTIPITAESVAQKIAFLLRVVAMTLTVLNLCTIWMDRLVALKLTFSHHRIIDNRTVMKILALSWSIGVALAVASVVMFSFQMETAAYEKWRYLTSIMTFVGFFVLIAANGIILREARMHARNIKRQSTYRRRAPFASPLKSTYMCVSMVTAFLLFWLPHLTANVNILVHGKALEDQWFTLFCALMILCNTVLHPCLYVMLNRETRKFISQKWRRSRSNHATKRSLEAQRSVSSIITISMRPI